MPPDTRSEQQELLEPLRLYLREASGTPLLTPAEEKVLALRVQEGERARVEMLGIAQAIVGRRRRDPEVRLVIASLRAILTPTLLERAATVISVQPQEPLGDVDILRAAVSITSQKIDVRNRQTIDVETQDTLAALLRVARLTEETLVPLARQLTSSARERRDLDEREQAAEDGERARHTLREANLLLVVSIAKRGKFRWGELSLQDRIQEGNVGLMKAVDGFDPDFGTRFSTYAVPIIAQAIDRAIKNQEGAVRVPVHVHDLVWRFRRDLGGQAVTAGLEQVGAAQRRTLRQGMRLSLPLAEWDGNSPATEAEGGGAAEARERVEAFRGRVRGLLAVLTDREAAIVSMRLGLDDGQPKTQREIGKVFAVTRAAIQQTEVRAIRKLEEAVAGKVDRREADTANSHGGYATLFTMIENGDSGGRVTSAVRARKIQRVPSPQARS
jgi:RNA polymerase primary sigma factor